MVNEQKVLYWMLIACSSISAWKTIAKCYSVCAVRKFWYGGVQVRVQELRMLEKWEQRRIRALGRMSWCAQ